MLAAPPPGSPHRASASFQTVNGSTMPASSAFPPPHPEVNAVLAALLGGVRSILADHLVGMYLDGSLACGDFDLASDIDFLVVTDLAVTPDLFSSLQAMHDRVAETDPRWGVELEGSYIPRAAIRRYDPSLAMHPNLERGKRYRLKMVHHDEDWIVHYHVVRERGIPLFGPEPKTLIDPVSPEDLRCAMQKILLGWWGGFLNHPAQLTQRGYQSYAVLSMCRILYTLEYGSVASKSAAARWAQDHLDRRWLPLIERAWDGRRNPGCESSAADIQETQEIIRFALARAGLLSNATGARK
jgi:predicted nucleotidyltransferase